MTRKEAGNPDLGEKLEQLRLARKVSNSMKDEADRLKKEMLDDVAAIGQYYFVDSDGNKRRGYYSDADLTIIDPEEAARCHDEGLISDETYDAIMPRKQDLEALETAVNAGRVPKVVIQRAVTVVKGRPTIKFSDPE